MKKKAVIIGAGPAGLTAALELLRTGGEGFEVVVLEESGSIGGLSRTVDYKGNKMDIGGHRFFSKDGRIMKWWEEMMPLQGKPAYDDKRLGREKELPEKGPDPESEDRVLLLRQRVSRIYYKKKFFDYPVSLKPGTIINMGLVQTVKAGCSYLASCVKSLPEDSLENFYINRFGRVLYSMFFQSYTQKLWGRSPKDISPDWGAQRVKGLSIRALLKDCLSKMLPHGKNRDVETSLIEEFLYPKYGPGQLWELAAAEIVERGGKIVRGAGVDEILCRDNMVCGVGFVRGDKSREKLGADILLSSMPLTDLLDSMGKTVPEHIKTVARGLPYRDFVTVGVLVEELALRNNTRIPTLNRLVPDCWIYVQDAGIKMGRIQIFNNWSPYMVSDAEHKVWIGLEYFCDEGDPYWNLPDDQWAGLASKELVQMGVLESGKAVLDFHVEKVKKAYPAYFDTYKDIPTLRTWLDGFENLYCIGRNGQHRYNNMDHSMATAMEAVANIISGKKTKENVWGVNTEKEYHEQGRSGALSGEYKMNT